MSWVSNSQASNQYAFQAADSQFEKNVNTPMMNKYQGGSSGINDSNNGKKQRMAGDYLSDFTTKFSDNSKANEVGIKDFRGDVKNNSVSSFLGNSAPKSNAGNQENVVPNADEFGKDSISPDSKASSEPEFRMTDRQGNVYNSQEDWDAMMADSKAQQAASKANQGKNFAANVRPEYREQAEKFYNQVEDMNVSDEIKGNVMTYMGGDMLLPDPDKVKAHWEKEYGDRPELLSNIMMYMGGGAGKVGHNR